MKWLLITALTKDGIMVIWWSCFYRYRCWLIKSVCVKKNEFNCFVVWCVDYFLIALLYILLFFTLIDVVTIDDQYTEFNTYRNTFQIWLLNWNCLFCCLLYLFCYFIALSCVERNEKSLKFLLFGLLAQ